MNPVIYGVVDPTATDPNLRMMPVSGTSNGDGTCSLDTTGGGGGGGSADSTAANQLTQIGYALNTDYNISLMSETVGYQADAAAGTDTSSVSLISLFKRHLQRWTTFFTLLPASLGSKADADSFAVTASTEDKMVQAAIAAILVSIDDGTPAALGQAAMAASMPVVLANNQSRVNVEPLGLPSAAQKITTSGTSGNVTLAAGTTRVSIYATKAAYFNIGTGSLVATSTDFFIGDNERLDFNVTAGGKLAAIQDSATGIVYITELA